MHIRGFILVQNILLYIPLYFSLHKTKYIFGSYYMKYYLG